jgi:ABC-type polysaccharide/polyol phosphate transport system ATPase subunit
MNKTISIAVNQVTLSWSFYHKKANQRKSSTLASAGGNIKSHKKDIVQVNALEDISFKIHHGEKLALIGHNGAGKSTLLRLLAGVFTPTAGSIHVNGRITTLFTSSVGMRLDATGYENIHLMSKILGIPLTSEIIRGIEEFSELGDFLNLPVRTYSAGMRMRLGFSIATSTNANIFLIDEVVGAGDKIFQDKAVGRIKDIIRNSSTIVLASHNITLLKSFCNLGLWIEAGHMKMFGPIQDVLAEYQKIL